MLPPFSAPTPFVSILAHMLLSLARQKVCEEGTKSISFTNISPRLHIIPIILNKELLISWLIKLGVKRMKWEAQRRENKSSRSMKRVI